MKRLIINRRGESLVESVLSILLLTLLMTSITIIVSSALNISKSTIEENELMQGTVNAAIFEEFEDPPKEETITFTNAALEIKQK